MSWIGQRQAMLDPFDESYAQALMDHLPHCPALLHHINTTNKGDDHSHSKEASEAIVSVPMDWKETVDAHTITLDLPGIRMKDIKVDIVDRKIVEIRGDRKEEVLGKDEKWRRVERKHGKLLRRFRLPEDGKGEEMKASLNNGVLTLTVPKAAIPKSEVKSVKIALA